MFVFETNKSLFITITERREERRNAFPSSQKQNFSLIFISGGAEILNSGKCWELGQPGYNLPLCRGEHNTHTGEAGLSSSFTIQQLCKMLLLEI